MKAFLFFASLLLLVSTAFGGEDVVFKTDFEKFDEGKEAGALEFDPAPGGTDKQKMLVLGEGEFKVKAADKNKVIELTPTPLDTFGLMFGPTETEDISAQLRALGTSTGRRFPVFGVGLNGVGGYIVRVNPAKKMIEVLKGEEVKTTVPYAWTSGTWTNIKMSVTKSGDAWVVQGKAWEQGKEEPKDWAVKFEDKEKPLAGRATLWGIPYSTTPIQFDDIEVKKIKN